MRGPSLADLWLHLGEAGAWRRIGNANQMLAGWTLNLPAGMTWIALQGLVAVGTVKFELRCAHGLDPYHAQTRHKKYMKEFSILFADKLRLIW